jgi:hypothetical protein
MPPFSMKRIPHQQQSSIPSSPLPSSFLEQALDVLWLGSLWVFVLIWLPYFEQLGTGLEFRDLLLNAFKAQAMTVLVLSVVNIIMACLKRHDVAQRHSLLQRGLVVAIVVVASLQLIYLAYGADYGVSLLRWASVVCALLGLGYFISRHQSRVLSVSKG